MAKNTNKAILLKWSEDRPIQQRQVTGFKGSFKEDLDLGSLGAGLYIVRVVTEDESFTRKVIVK